MKKRGKEKSKSSKFKPKMRASKKSLKSSKKTKVFFDNKKLVAITIGVFLIAAIALAFVKIPQASFTGQATTSISDLFANWETGQLDVNIAKYLFWFMVTGLIWGALSWAKFPKKGVFQALIAIPVAFLATAYLTPDEVFTILQSYEALGIVLTFILPFVILIFISAMLVSNEKIRHMSVAKIMLEVFLWVFYVVILGYKIISGIAKGEVPLGLNLPILIMLGVFLVSFFILILNKTFRNWMWNLGNELRGAREEAMSAGEVAREKSRRRMADFDEHNL